MMAERQNKPKQKALQEENTGPVKHYLKASSSESMPLMSASLDDSQQTVAVELKVWCPTFNRKDSTLCVTGSTPELGSWKIDQAPVAYSTQDSHIWKVEVFLPTFASFEWSWAIKKTNPKLKPEMEYCKRRVRKLNGFSGTLHSKWGEEEEVFLQSVTSVELTTFRLVDKGQSLVVSGSTPTTGNWLLKEAVKATEFPPMSGYWKAYVSFDAQNVLSFKWIIVEDKNPERAVTAEQGVHWLCGRPGWLQVVAPWNQPAAYVVGRELMEHTTNRTDLIILERKQREHEIMQWHDSVLPSRTSERLSKANSEDVIVELVNKLSLSKATSNINNRLTRPNKARQTSKRITMASRLSSFQLTKPSKKVQKLDMNEEEYSPSPGILLLKGKGQTSASQDLSLADVQNQVPLLDVAHILRPGPTLLLQEDDALQKPSKKGNQESALKSDFDNLSKKEKKGNQESALKSDFDNQSKKEKTSETPAVVDVLFAQLDKATEMIARLKTLDTQERGGIPVIEKDVGAVTTQLPTWSMMVEENLEQSLRHIDTPERTPNKPPPPAKAPARQVPPKQESPELFFSSLHKAISLQAASAARQQIEIVASASFSSISSVTSTINEPSGLGHDDFLKSKAEIIEERRNRKIWKLLREKFHMDNMAEQENPQEKKGKRVTIIKRIVKKTHSKPSPKKAGSSTKKTESVQEQES